MLFKTLCKEQFPDFGVNFVTKIFERESISCDPETLL
jgi:hypothetical protein